MDFVEKVAEKYPHLSKSTVESIVDRAKMFYFGLQYPCEPDVNETTRPIDSFVAKLWILSACDEMIERLGFSSAVAYKENGMSWSFDSAQLSDKLCNLIKPISNAF